MFFSVFILCLLMSAKAFANPACPICTVAVGASLEIARRLGVDDGVVGVWAGGFLVLLGFWTLRWMDKKGWNFRYRDFIILSLSVLMILFMYISQLVYTPKAILIFWLDPFLFTTIVGALVFYYSSEFYQWMKKNNGGHAHFPFEKVVVPVVALALTSWIFYYLEICQPTLPDLSQI